MWMARGGTSVSGVSVQLSDRPPKVESARFALLPVTFTVCVVVSSIADPLGPRSS
jgi:hypothetical protein